REGIRLGQIKAKGLHTTLMMHVAIAEDSRFVFAGVLRQVAMHHLSNLPHKQLQRCCCMMHDPGLSALPSDLLGLVKTTSFSDAKLKGFGAVAVLQHSGPEPEYRLFCGRGIKSIHIWRFRPELGLSVSKPPIPQAESTADKWSCIYDTQSNGMTIDIVGFRKGGYEGMSRSENQCIRLWDLTSNDKRPPFKDIPNTNDAKGVFGDYAYGGGVELSIVKLDAARWANRQEL
ncbi:unnamed protein product, partial [Chrysoparadoxa australica]